MSRLLALVCIVGVSCSHMSSESYTGELSETTNCNDSMRTSRGAFKRMVRVNEEHGTFTLYDSTLALSGRVLAKGAAKFEGDRATILSGNGRRDSGTVLYTVHGGTLLFDGDELTVHIVVETHPDSADACTTVSEGTLTEYAYGD